MTSSKPQLIAKCWWQEIAETAGNNVNSSIEARCTSAPRCVWLNETLKALVECCTMLLPSCLPQDAPAELEKRLRPADMCLLHAGTNLTCVCDAYAPSPGVNKTIKSKQAGYTSVCARCDSAPRKKAEEER